jgi:peptide/nickel transport system permease protein
MGLDQPWLQRYWHWLLDLLQGDLGRSIISQQPVTDVLPSKLGITAELVGLSFLFALALAIPLALASARRPNGGVDRASQPLAGIALSLPAYVIAPLLSYVFAYQLGWLPAIWSSRQTAKGPLSHLEYMTLPVLSLGLGLLFFYARFLRSDLVDQMQGQDYIMTARAKGLGPWRVLVRHAFRNSSFGLITFVGLNISAFFGLTVIVEFIFGLPGLGGYLLASINTRDYVVLQSLTLIFALITVFANLITDMLYAVLDPRIRYGSR